MCGIAGYWNFLADETTEVMRDKVERMTNALRPRGPDSGGILLDPAAGLALGHRRLAIRDLSPAGQQPMTTGDDRFSLVYNGEIYDTAALRRRLEARGAVFRGSSDTEELLLACVYLGLPAALREMTGMFAFALFDHQTRKLYLVKDRFGVKPLYWGMFGDLFLFGSELKALTVLPDWPQTICRDAVAEFLGCGYINAPLSIWQGIHKLRPGHWLEVDRNGGIEEHSFWDSLAEAQTALREPLPPNEEEILRELDTTLGKAVRIRMVSDVPLGAFLSGGVDSSLITALMQKVSPQPVRTFSIGFEEQAYNEAPYAKAVAAYLGTIHTEAYLREAEVLELIPHIPEMYDEPFADPSQLPTFLLSRLTRGHVVVALSGDGGDELFSGYDRYILFIETWRHWRWSLAGKPLRNRLVRFLGKHFSQPFLDRLAGMLPRVIRPVDCGRRIRRRAALLNLAPWQYYRRCYLSYWTDALPLLQPPPACATRRTRWICEAWIWRLRRDWWMSTPICRAVSLRRWTGQAWRHPWKCGRPCWIIMSSASRGACRPACIFVTVCKNISCVGCCTAMCRKSWWTGPKWALASPLIPGCAGHCAPGRKPCFTPNAWRRKAGWMRPP